jgi:hypothetical protein
MSQNQPKPPVPPNQTPLAPKPTSDKLVKSLQNVLQILEQAWNRAKPVLITQSIKALRKTIQLLQVVVNKLEAAPIEKPSPAVIKESPAVTAPLPEISASTPAATPLAPVLVEQTPVETVDKTDTPQDVSVSSTPVVSPTVVPVEQTAVTTPVAQLPAKPNLVNRFLPSFDRIGSWRNATLQKIRAILPQSVSSKLSDWALIGAIGGVLVLLLWTSAGLISRKPAEVATIPAPAIPTPPELTAPTSPEPVPIEPVPPPVLTPEQELIASIENQVAEITQQYGDGLVQSLQANFQATRLIVNVSDGWYNLTPSQQDSLADEILHRSEELDFSKLEITDPEGTVVARNPAVGKHMVILKRQVPTVNYPTVI